MIQLLVNYTNNNNNNINVNIIKKDKYDNHPLLLACNRNDIEMFQLLISYSNKNNIITKY